MLRDKFAGCLIGVAVADALGVPHEFYYQRNNVYTGSLYLIPSFTSRAGSRSDVVGQISDDTEMTICLLRSIIENNGYVTDKCILAYEEWAAHAKALGKNTRALFKNITTVKGFWTRWNKQFKDVDQSKWSQSNGSLMRASMLSFLDDKEIITDCQLSNPHPNNIQANLVYSRLMKACLEEEIDKTALLNSMLSSFGDDIKTVINQVLQKIPRIVNTYETKGWVLNALYCAIWGWYNFTTYHEAIDAIIRLGGDTDTNAAIAGGLIGCTLGYNSLMQEKITANNIKIVREADYSKGDNPRPDKYGLNDFDKLIDDFTSLFDYK